MKKDYIHRRTVMKSLATLPLIGMAACNKQEEAVVASPAGPVANPLIIAHRGASGYRPEHTLASYKLAIEMGADYIEPDLVFTKDGVLIARHDRYLSTTTDVADHPEFTERRRTRGTRTDWFTEDFTLEEIKTLRARQAFPGRSIEFDDQLEIPTLDEVIALAKSAEVATGRKIGLYPETKAPGYFKERGYDYTPALLGVLEQNGLNVEGAPIFIQSFEKPVLQNMRDKTPLPLVFLTSYSTGFSVEEISEYCDGLGPNKNLLVNGDKTSTGLLEQAHAKGLKVHPWTFRSDQLPTMFDTPEEELAFFFNFGVDGVFTDFPDTALAVRGDL